MEVPLTIRLRLLGKEERDALKLMLGRNRGIGEEVLVEWGQDSVYLDCYSISC